jgi:hypothetical protein
LLDGILNPAPLLQKPGKQAAEKGCFTRQGQARTLAPPRNINSLHSQWDRPPGLSKPFSAAC